jgi:hypothetical protein
MNQEISFMKAALFSNKSIRDKAGKIVTPLSGRPILSMALCGLIYIHRSGILYSRISFIFQENFQNSGKEYIKYLKLQQENTACIQNSNTKFHYFTPMNKSWRYNISETHTLTEVVL